MQVISQGKLPTYESFPGQVFVRVWHSIRDGHRSKSRAVDRPSRVCGNHYLLENGERQKIIASVMAGDNNDKSWKTIIIIVHGSIVLKKFEASPLEGKAIDRSR